jgi:hypothetical protein
LNTNNTYKNEAYTQSVEYQRAEKEYNTLIENRQEDIKLKNDLIDTKDTKVKDSVNELTATLNSTANKYVTKRNNLAKEIKDMKTETRESIDLQVKGLETSIATADTKILEKEKELDKLKTTTQNESVKGISAFANLVKIDEGKLIIIMNFIFEILGILAISGATMCLYEIEFVKEKIDAVGKNDEDEDVIVEGLARAKKENDVKERLQKIKELGVYKFVKNKIKKGDLNNEIDKKKARIGFDTNNQADKKNSIKDGRNVEKKKSKNKEIADNLKSEIVKSLKLNNLSLKQIINYINIMYNTSKNEVCKGKNFLSEKTGLTLNQCDSIRGILKMLEIVKVEGKQTLIVCNKDEALKMIDVK